MNMFYLTPELTPWANDSDALIPEIWAPEALRVLMSNMVFGSLVNRDFSDRVASFGDIVNTSRPNDFKGKRKTKSDNVTVQDAVSNNIPVPLDQHVHVSFQIEDEDLSKALPDLVDRYLEPAAREVAETVDRILAGQVARLSTHAVGRLTEMDKTNAAEFILAADTLMKQNRAPIAGRNLVLGPVAEGAALGAEIVTRADQRGDGGEALENARVGRVYGFDTFMDQNVNYVDSLVADTGTGVTDNAEAAGSTTVETTVADAPGVKAGAYVVVEGEGRPHRIASSSGDPEDIVLTEGLVNAVSSGAGVTVYFPGAVNLVAGYAAGWSKEIVVNGHTANKGPQVGQQVTFGTGASSHTYTIIAVTVVTSTESQILLDRPLEASIANADDAYYGPAGGVNLAFHRDAVALVVRPLAAVPSGTGAASMVANFGDLSMRVTMQYQGLSQGMLVTFDLLCGVAVLDDRLAVVVYS